VFCILALFIFPPLFGLLGFIYGIVNCAQNRIGHGVTQIFLSLFCGMVGMAIGAALYY
jgi:hypothetical protein